MPPAKPTKSSLYVVLGVVALLVLAALVYFFGRSPAEPELVETELERNSRLLQERMIEVPQDLGAAQEEARDLLEERTSGNAQETSEESYDLLDARM